ncbi:MAG: alpha/beta hydrolase [Myxococcales bacterium]|nr:alpha/beta hydrolase [Myxococcales bacterium]
MPTLQRTDTALAYEQAGQTGPHVLLVQGAGCVGNGWRPQIDDLVRDHRVIWFDNRGIGASVPLRGPVTVAAMAQDCLHLLDQLGVERIHAVGHSLGGLIVQELARIATARVRSVSLISTLWRGRDIAVPSLANLKVSLGMLFGSERKRWLTAARLCFPPAYLSTLPDEEALRLMRLIFCADFPYQPPIVRKQIAALWQHRGGDMAALQTIPTLILTGAHDIVVHTRLSDDLKARLLHARIERFADAGHGLPLQHGSAVNQRLRDHIAGAEEP